MSELVKLLDVANKPVTADAMHAQRETAKTVPAKGGDLPAGAEGDQQELRDDVALLPGRAAVLRVGKTRQNRHESRNVRVAMEFVSRFWASSHSRISGFRS